jgi:predicted DCC family thiol-disulfide oxidoreductase YuxK
MKNMNNAHQSQKIIFFDGICLLCNRTVDFLLKNDRKKSLKFASLQSAFAVDFLQQLRNQAVKEDTIIFYDEGQLLIKSTAVLKIAAYLGMPYALFAVFFVIPRPWRDLFYDIIARNRAKWFGSREQCRVPDQETSGRIIA